MTLKERFPKAFVKNPKKSDTNALLAALENMYHELDGETQARIQRYRDYNNFFNGVQWYRQSRGASRHTDTINYCEPIVVKYASLLVGDKPTIRVPLLSDVDPESDVAGFQGYGDKQPNFSEDANRSEILNKVLNKIVYKDNPGEKILYEGAKGGSLYGDTVFYLDYDEKETTFKLQNIFPGYVRAAFSTDDYQEVDYVILQHIVTIDYVARKYNVEVMADSAQDYAGTTLVWNSRKFTDSSKYVILKTYYDNDVKILFTHDKVISITEHGYECPPFFFIPNRIDPYQPWGISDLRDILPIQERYNRAVSNQEDIIELFANPKIIGRNLTNQDIQAIRKATGNVIPLKRDADLQPFQFTSQIYPIQQEIESAKNAIHDVSGLPPVFFGTAQGSIVTGVALTAQAAPTLQIVNAKSLNWVATLKRMLSFMLDVLCDSGATLEIGEKKVKFKDICLENYDVDVQTNIRTPRDDAAFIQNEINKTNFRIQSRLTTMENLGIKSPDNEMMKIAHEELSPIYTGKPETLLNEQLRIPQDLDQLYVQVSDDVKKMSLGEQIPSPANNADEAKLDLEVMSKFVQENMQTLPPEAVAAFDARMAQDEEIINAAPGPKNFPKASKAPGQTNFPTQLPANGPAIPNPTLPPDANGQQASPQLDRIFPGGMPQGIGVPGGQ